MRDRPAQQPRFHAEYSILEYLKELERYATVFHERISRSFSGLEEEAKCIENETYSRLGENVNPEYADPSYGIEEAFHAGVEYYLTIDAIRQGIYNLMIAGLFHMLEQQSQYLATRVLSNPIIPPDGSGGFKQIKALLLKNFQINIEHFQCWTCINELRLVANTVKHGDGGSSEELKRLNPDLFKSRHDPFPEFSAIPLRPLVGEGLRLSEDHFKNYKSCIDNFWEELTAALLPIFCPPPHLSA